MFTEIRRLREAQGWSRFQLALRAGVTPDTVAAVERGDSVTLRSLRAIADALGLRVALVQHASQEGGGVNGEQ